MCYKLIEAFMDFGHIVGFKHYLNIRFSFNDNSTTKLNN